MTPVEPPTEEKPPTGGGEPATVENKPPDVSDAAFEIEATIEPITQSLSPYYSDPDGDAVSVSPQEEAGPPFSFSLTRNGELTFNAPSVTGSYTFPFTVTDSQGGARSANFTARVTFPETLKSELSKVAELDNLEELIAEKERQLKAQIPSGDLMSLKNELLSKTELLSKPASEKGLQGELEDLTHALQTLERPEDKLQELEALKQSLAATTEAHTKLVQDSLNDGIDITAIKARLRGLNESVSTLNNEQETINLSALISAPKLEALNSSYEALKKAVSPNWLMMVIGALALLALLGVGAALVGRARTKRAHQGGEPNQIAQPKKNDIEQEDPEGQAIASFPVFVVSSNEKGFGKIIKNYPQEMNNYNPETGELDIPEPSWGIFPDNPSFQTYKEPLLEADLPKDSKGPDLQSSAKQSWQTVYKATGRIGLAQDGIPIGDDDSYGTCVLVGPKHIMTNRHVFDRYWKLIMKETENTGVEFHGEVDSDASEFYEIAQVNPTILEERDAVILTLKKEVDISRRAPVEFSSKDPETYAEDEIMVIGYPQEPFNLDDLDDRQSEVYGEIEIFGVKRYSVGQIISHTTDHDDDYIVETQTSGKYSKEGVQPAITHLVSTLPGNSGSPIVSTKTGHVIGLHFGGGAFETEPANVGHSGLILAEFVMSVTTDAFTS